MNIILFKISIVLTITVFLFPKQIQYYLALILHISIAVITSIWAVNTLFFTSKMVIHFIPFLGKILPIEIDQLTAFFILIINFTTFTGIIYAKGYLQPYFNKMGKIEITWHFFNFLWLHISMLLVVMLREALPFLMIWEIMSMSSFFLVIFESDKEKTIKIGINYLIQMHIGLAFLMAGFILAYMQEGAEFSFDGLSVYFQSHYPFGLFLLFFIGFGIKAGFVPLHSWLPHAHPAAPSHVSGVMSGVMIKMGIYGILRVLMYIHNDLFPIGLFILIISLATGLIGISLAIIQRDVKKLLAYSSIENIGIIGIGIGLGIIGISENIPVLAVLAFAGSFLHVLNHSLFKSLLFYTAGSVYKQTHTRNIEQLGGLIKKMPVTALSFLLGALAISGLPPFNGFISEFMLYSGMFKSLYSANMNIDVILLFSFLGLSLIGGLAIFCFTKVFSIIFLGNPRSDKVEHSAEVSSSMILPNIMIGFMIILIGFMPVLFVEPIARILSLFTKDISVIQQLTPTLNKISLASGLFVISIGIVWLLRAWQQNKQKIQQDETWGCGYTGANPALHQYTATSYADSFAMITPSLVNIKKDFKEFDKEEVFPQARHFETHSSDIFENNLITKPVDKILFWLEKIAVFQTGKIQHYLLYALLFLIFVLLLTYFNWL